MPNPNLKVTLIHTSPLKLSLYPRIWQESLCGPAKNVLTAKAAYQDSHTRSLAARWWQIFFFHTGETPYSWSTCQISFKAKTRRLVSGGFSAPFLQLSGREFGVWELRLFQNAFMADTFVIFKKKRKSSLCGSVWLSATNGRTPLKGKKSQNCIYQEWGVLAERHDGFFFLG